MRYETGIAAEEAVRRHYEAQGASLLAARWRPPLRKGLGEIDLIFSQDGATIFVEVKARATHAKAADSLTWHQRQRLLRSAELWLAERPTPARLDAALVDGAGEIHIIENITQ
ncbi:YraN family protein [Paracoccaceae bacterium GXU_MW_L88]